MVRIGLRLDGTFLYRDRVDYNVIFMFGFGSVSTNIILSNSDGVTVRWNISLSVSGRFQIELSGSYQVQQDIRSNSRSFSNKLKTV